jgi:hypothetical protein
LTEPMGSDSMDLPKNIDFWLAGGLRPICSDPIDTPHK